MPCSDSSSSITLKLDNDERFVGFDYAKITCGQTITADTGLNAYFYKKTLEELLAIPFETITNDLDLKEEESKFVLYLEWDALRSAVAQYLGIADEHIDSERCRITSIEQTEEGLEVAEVILPPKELPKILPCSMADQRKTQIT